MDDDSEEGWKKVGGSKVSHQIKALATNPDNLSLIPGSYIMEEENQSQKLAPHLHTHAVEMCSHTQRLVSLTLGPYL